MGHLGIVVKREDYTDVSVKRLKLNMISKSTTLILLLYFTEITTREDKMVDSVPMRKVNLCFHYTSKANQL